MVETRTPETYGKLDYLEKTTPWLESNWDQYKACLTSPNYTKEGREDITRRMTHIAFELWCRYKEAHERVYS